MNINDTLNSLLPTYEVVLPFSNKKVKFTPFKVKDLKNISIILQEDDKKLSLLSLIKILEQNSDIKNARELCLPDAEYLFLQIRSKSIDEILHLIINGEKKSINISEIKTKNKIQNQTYSLNADISFYFETPTLEDIINLEKFDEENYKKLFIKKIFLKNELYDIKKYVSSEIKNILENLPLKCLQFINEFNKNEPSLFIEYNDNEGEAAGALTFFIFQ